MNRLFVIVGMLLCSMVIGRCQVASYYDVPLFSGNVSTDVNWNSHIGGGYVVAAGDGFNRTNMEGVSSIRLGPISGTSISDLYITLPNHFGTNGQPVWHIMRFWMRGDWGLPGEQMDLSMANMALPSVYDMTNGPWRMFTYVVPSFVGSSGTFKWLLRANNGSSAISAHLDAFQWIPVYSTDLVIKRINERSLMLQWPSVYGILIEYKTNLLSSTWMTSPQPGQLVQVGNMYSMSVEPVGSRKFFRVYSPNRPVVVIPDEPTPPSGDPEPEDPSEDPIEDPEICWPPLPLPTPPPMEP